MSEETQKLTVIDQVKKPEFLAEIGKALPSGYSPERFVRVALNAFIRNPLITRTCTQRSIIRCLIDLASLGLECDGRRAHLIPFKDECTLIIDYKGLIDIILRGSNSHVSHIHGEIICANDKFEHNAGEVITHTWDVSKPRGDEVAAYVQLKLKDGNRQSCIISKDDINKIRDASQGYKYALANGKQHPWINQWGEMAKKTCLRRLSKWLYLSPETRDAFEVDDSDYDTTPLRRPVASAESDPLLVELTTTPTRQPGEETK